jgi:shikimate kinase
MSNIVLVGFMGSGKSTVGRILADRLESEFVDTDCLIEERTGRSIQKLFSQDGEAQFREIEARVVRSVASRDRQVIAAGGGVVLRPENVACLKGSGRVVYLRLTEEELLERTKHLRGRPLLEGDDRRKRVRELLRKRRGLYEGAADVIIDTGELTPAQAADAIAERLGLE